MPTAGAQYNVTIEISVLAIWQNAREFHVHFFPALSILSKIATSKLGMQPEIKFWQPKFLNWLPTAGYLPFSLDVFKLQQDQEDTVHQYIVHQFTVP